MNRMIEGARDALAFVRGEITARITQNGETFEGRMNERGEIVRVDEGWGGGNIETDPGF